MSISKEFLNAFNSKPLFALQKKIVTHVTIVEAEEYQEPPEDAKLFIENLPYDVDSEWCSNRLVIGNRETDRSREFGFVTMSTIEEAEKAVMLYNHYVSYLSFFFDEKMMRLFDC
ncbi:hypothetical protein P3S68_004280 [Capsicum galapagoense]